ncbi:Ger(x)C family spore germination protein [Litchfieldia alkalitelluris]|uniref:Ger(x)C family spore germination protein n=1 Tax=Litchfieldia alkalitelluris TaxID=304268 RepID=UPI000996F50B|nr:Ger(x)C family spore germination protein [Litchfieldia alkalitelluris]
MRTIVIGMAFFILVVVTFTSGRVEKEIVDEINIATAIGIDAAKENEIKGTVVIPVFLADQSIENASFEGKSVLAREVVNELQNKSADPLVTGGIRVALYGEEVAKKGINEYVDALQRDASIGSRVFLAVVDGEASEILTKTLGNRGTGTYLRDMLSHNMNRRDLPEMNLHLFVFRYYTKGMDPFLPYIKLIEDKVEIKGLAIFKEEKMIDVVDQDNLFFFKALVQNFGEGTHTVYLEEEDEYASIKRIVSKRKIKVEEVNGDPKVTVQVYLQGVLSEYSGRKTDEGTVQAIISELEKEIIYRSEKLIKKYQKMNADPIGIGYFAQSTLRGFDEEKWRNGYPDVEIKVEAEVDLIQTGIIE